MIRAKTWIMILIAALAVSGVAFAGTSGPSPIPNPPAFSVTTNSLVFCRGETNYVPITVTDGGPAGASYPSVGVSNLTGTAMDQVELSVSPGKGILPEGIGTVYIGVIHANSSSTANIPLFVSSNASLITSIGVQIGYSYDVFYTDSETRNLTFEVVSCGSPLAISVNPKTVTSGEIQNLTINFTNAGNATLNNLYVHYSMPGLRVFEVSRDMVTGAWLSAPISPTYTGLEPKGLKPLGVIAPTLTADAPDVPMSVSTNEIEIMPPGDTTVGDRVSPEESRFIDPMGIRDVLLDTCSRLSPL